MSDLGQHNADTAEFAGKPEPASAKNRKNAARSSPQIWKNRASLRVIMSAFATVFLTQTILLIFMVLFYKAEKLSGLQNIPQALLVIFFMSGLFTGALMLVLRQWLLKPMFRQNTDNLKRLHMQAEGKIHKLAYFDRLTGLPNRTYFLEKLNDSIKHKMREDGDILAVLTVDIDHFRDINDTMGHEIGDKLLQAVGKRLVKALPDEAVVSRVSADEFTVMVHLKAGQPDSSVLAERIFTAMLDPVSILQENFQVRTSIGVSHFPDDGVEAHQILKNANIALNRAKEEGRDTVRYYSQDLDQTIQQRFQLLRNLRGALEKKQLQVYYHPQFDLKTGQLIGAEALLRWWLPDNSKEGGKYISPAEFIPIAEQSGLIVPIGEYVLRTACEAGKMWQEKGLPPIRIAVNISGVQFHRSDIASLVANVLKETGLDPQWLELEVTESVLMGNLQSTIDILDQLHNQGIELSVDDFGTGYSSLSYLRQFPIDRLKIDQSFIRNALLSLNDRMIIRTIISLGHSLGLKVIAEGVETSDHEELLKEEGCDEVQGFKYTKPIPADKFWNFFIAHVKKSRHRDEAKIKNLPTGGGLLKR